MRHSHIGRAGVRKGSAFGKLKTTAVLLFFALAFGGMFVHSPIAGTPSAGWLFKAFTGTQAGQTEVKTAEPAAEHAAFEYFSPFRGTTFSAGEKVALCLAMATAFAALGFAAAPTPA